ncbi:hypothetical protein GCM10023224_11720 [Streptomonospora halophila]|uniref:Uncharacterized protein n=1 Tax=Streptomonospora halophila TaxID=427369 RepID=A0ABP9GCE1_9ACTN
MLHFGGQFGPVGTIPAGAGSILSDLRVRRAYRPVSFSLREADKSLTLPREAPRRLELPLGHSGTARGGAGRVRDVRSALGSLTCDGPRARPVKSRRVILPPGGAAPSPVAREGGGGPGPATRTRPGVESGRADRRCRGRTHPRGRLRASPRNAPIARRSGRGRRGIRTTHEVRQEHH